MKVRNKKITDRYATLIYLYYTKNNRVADVHDYPDYISDENSLGFSIPFIKKMFSNGLLADGECFTVTEKGEAMLAEGQDYIDFFNINSPYVSITDYAQLEDEGSFEEKMIKLFEQKLIEYRQKKNYVAIESLNMELADLALSMGEEKKALFYCLTYLEIAMSGIKDYIYVSRYKKNKITRKELMFKIQTCIYVNPYVLLNIERLKEHYSDEMVDEVYDALKLGYNLCTRERFKEVVKSIMDGEYNNAYWQRQTTIIFRKRMGFKPPKSKKAQAKLETAEVGSPEPEQDSTQILGDEVDQSEDEVAVSDAKMDEIVEAEAKK